MNFELDRFDSCVIYENGYKFSVQLMCGECRYSISKTANDRVTCEFYESGAYPTLVGASLYLNKRAREIFSRDTKQQPYEN